MNLPEDHRDSIFFRHLSKDQQKHYYTYIEERKNKEKKLYSNFKEDPSL